MSIIFESRLARLLTNVVGLVLVLWLALLLMVAFAFPAAAVTDVDPVTGVDWFNYSEPGNVVLLVGILIPVITAIITKKVASSQIKAISTLTLTAITATVGTLVGLDGEWAWREFGNAFMSTFVPAIASYYGFWKHSAVTRVVTEKTADFGVLVQRKTLENDTRPDGPGPEDVAAPIPLRQERPVDEPLTDPSQATGGDAVDLGEGNPRNY